MNLSNQVDINCIICTVIVIFDRYYVIQQDREDFYGHGIKIMYGLKLSNVTIYIIAGTIIWALLGICLRKKKIWKYMNGTLMLIGLYGISHYTVLGRHISSSHQFILWMDPTHNEFLREMVMNIFLYFPFGLALANVLRSYLCAIITVLLLSISIELWQYLAGTGVAQLTDVICNVLGGVIGGLSFMIVKDKAHGQN